MKCNRLFLELLLLLPVALNAQSLEVKEAFLAGSDVSASQFSRTAPDGKACALVKVRLPLPDVTFVGPVVGEVENHSGEYWVFLPSNSSELIVNHKTFGEATLDFNALIQSRLQPKTTYVVVMLSKTDDKPKHLFVLQVTPTDATVIVDSEQFTPQNGNVTISLEEGSHDYVVTAEGYEMQTGTFDITSADNQPMKVTLTPASVTSLTPAEQYQIGFEYTLGSETRQKDYKKAISYLEPAAESGDISSQYLLASLYKLGAGGKPDYNKSFALFQKAAAGGMDDAKCEVAEHYLEGKGTEKNEKLAIDMLTRLADSGVERALLKLGNCHLQGIGVKKNVKKGVSWLVKAADKGNVKAIYELGDGYITGRFGKKDPYKATSYLVKGVELHDIDCTKRLGKIYLNGEGGVKEDLGKAAALVRMAKLYEKQKK